MKKQQKGFAVMPAETVKRISRMGGLTVSDNREHMREIGKRGGIISGIKRKRKEIENLNVEP